MKTVADRMVEILKEAGVKTVFGIPSIHNLGLYEALRKTPDIKHILCRHESTATHMADGYARESGMGYLLFASSGRDMALMGGVAVLAGCFVHLFLDEFSSFDLKLGFIPFPKRSMGTAFKLGSDSVPATAFVYLLLGFVALTIFVPGSFRRLFS